MSREFGICGSGGGSSQIQLAPDLTYPSSLLANNPYSQIFPIDASSGLTTALSLSGKFAVSHLDFRNMTSESNNYKLTIDGDVVMDDTFVSGTSQSIVGNNADTLYDNIVILCETSLVLQIETASDTSILLNYVAREIL